MVVVVVMFDVSLGFKVFVRFTVAFLVCIGRFFELIFFCRCSYCFSQCVSCFLQVGLSVFIRGCRVCFECFVFTLLECCEQLVFYVYSVGFRGFGRGDYRVYINIFWKDIVVFFVCFVLGFRQRGLLFMLVVYGFLIVFVF